MRRTGERVKSAVAGLFVVATFGTACSDRTDRVTRIVAPAPASSSARSDDARSSDRNTSVQWNGIARALVAARNTGTPMASRTYALVSVAQFRAVVALAHQERSQNANAKHGAALDGAIARASANVLAGLYPDAASAAVIAAALQEDEQALDGNPAEHRALEEGEGIGAEIAQAVLARAATDGAAGANCPATPPTPASQFWHDDAVPPNPQPVLPCFGNVRTWLGLDLNEFRADPPPPFGSPAFVAEVAAVRRASDTRTAAQLAIVDKWLDGANTFGISGRWNLIASDLIARDHLDAAEAARIFAVLNVAMMDAHVACWDRKYVYWEIRPWQVDPLITTPRGQPHHPANPSGHSCAGGAGSGALGHFFPAERDSLFALGDEDGLSTLLAGVHYPTDIAKGLQIGHTIAERTVAVRDLGEVVGAASRR